MNINEYLDNRYKEVIIDDTDKAAEDAIDEKFTRVFEYIDEVAMLSICKAIYNAIEAKNERSATLLCYGLHNEIYHAAIRYVEGDHHEQA